MLHNQNFKKQSPNVYWIKITLWCSIEETLEQASDPIMMSFKNKMQKRSDILLLMAKVLHNKCEMYGQGS